MTSPTSKLACSSNSSLNPLQDDDLSDLTKKEVVYWSQKLKISPSKIFSLSQEELDKILQKVLPVESNQEEIKAQCKRWEQLSELKQLLIDNQQDDRLEGGNDRNIWSILAQAANDIEEIYGSSRSHDTSSSVFASYGSPNRPVNQTTFHIPTPNPLLRSSDFSPATVSTPHDRCNCSPESHRAAFNTRTLRTSPNARRTPNRTFDVTLNRTFNVASNRTFNVPAPQRGCCARRPPPDATYDLSSPSHPEDSTFSTFEYETGLSSYDEDDYTFESSVDESFDPELASTPCQNNATYNAGATPPGRYSRLSNVSCPSGMGHSTYTVDGTPSGGHSRLSNVTCPSGMGHSTYTADGTPSRGHSRLSNVSMPTYTATPLSVQSRLSVVSPPSGIQDDSWAPQQIAHCDESQESPLFRNYTDYSIRYSPDGTQETANSISVESYDGTSGQVTASSRTFTLPPATSPTDALELSNISPPAMASGCVRRPARGQDLSNITPPALASGCRSNVQSPSRCPPSVSAISPPAFASGCPRPGSPMRSRNELSNFTPPSMASGVRQRATSPGRSAACSFDLGNVSPPSGLAGAGICPQMLKAHMEHTPPRSRRHCPRRIINDE